MGFQLGKIGNGLFLLISGYFLCCKNDFNINKTIKKIILQVLFVTLALIWFSIIIQYFNILTPLPSLFYFNEYWWFIGYFLIVIIIGKYLNPIINKLDKYKYKYDSILLIMFASVSFSFFRLFTDGIFDSLSTIITGVFLFLLGGYIKSYVLESDLYLYNSNLIRKYEYWSNFLGKKVERTDDWCFEDKNGIITKEKVGGINCYQMYGISYYDSIDAKQIEKDIKEVYDSPGGKEKYWEQVILDVCKKNYKIHIRECHEGDINEIDTFNELKQIDPVYNV